MGAYARRGAKLGGRLRPGVRAVPRLQERRKQAGGTLSGGEQQMLAIGRALMAQPEGAAARRAVDGPGADARRADLRRSSPRSTRRARRSCSSSRTRRRRCSGPTAPTCWRPDSVVQARDEASELLDDESVKAAYLGGDISLVPGHATSRARSSTSSIGADHAGVERPELRVERRRLVEAHRVDDLLQVVGMDARTA